LVVGVASGASAPVRADGAFPEAQSVLLPLDRPDEIVLATTFGLVSTEDDGATWHLSCEAANTPMTGGARYAMGPPPENRIYAKTDIGVALSSNSACTWTIGGGVLSSTSESGPAVPFDIFPDSTDPQRVYVLTYDAVTSGMFAFRSLDGGASYAGPIYTSAASGVLTGIESSASASGIVYLTLYQNSLVQEAGVSGSTVRVHPQLATSSDGGDTWATADLESALGPVVPWLVAVDPTDPRTIVLRVVSAGGAPEAYQGLAVTRDGGTTWTVPLKVAKGFVSGFARLSDQTWLAVGQTAPASPDDLGAPTLFRSDDGGQTFETQPLPFHPVGLAQRNGTAFGVARDPVDGFALASSSDGGRTWLPRLRFREIKDVKECVRSLCGSQCDTLVRAAVFPPEVCRPHTTGSGSGCGCQVVAPEDARAQMAWDAALLLTACLIRRRALKSGRATAE
jgi:hypothetical protein